MEFTETLSPFNTETQSPQCVLTICGSMCKLFDMRESRARLAQVPNWEVLIPEVFHPETEEQIRNGKYKDTAEIKKEFNVIKDHHDNIARANWVLLHNSDKDGKKGYIGANTFLEAGFAHVLGKPLYILNGYKENTFMVDELDAIGATVLNGSLDRMVNYMEDENRKSQVTR